MSKKTISKGVVHFVPSDIRAVLISNQDAHSVWESVTPLARNEWICWIESAKKMETRKCRIEIMLDKFKQGKRRPCCWAGCTHRN